VRGCEDKPRTPSSATGDLGMKSSDVTTCSEMGDSRTSTPDPQLPAEWATVRPQRNLGRGSKNINHTPDETPEERKTRNSHNIVEKQYRNHLNDRFERLLSVLPSSLRSPGTSDSNVEVRLSKRDVLDMSTTYIRTLESQRTQLEKENEELTNSISQLHQIKEETPESRSGHDTTPPSGPPAMSVSPRPGAPPTTPSIQSRPMRDEATESLYSHTPRSDLDSVATETFLDERKSRIIERVVRDVTNRIKAMFLQARGSSSPTSNPSDLNMASKPMQNGRNTTGSATGDDKNLKRKRDDRDNRDTDEEDEGTNNYRQKDTDEAKQENPGYACPYFKYNPSLYKSARGCPGPGWPNAHRVKCVLISVQFPYT